MALLAEALPIDTNLAKIPIRTQTSTRLAELLTRTNTNQTQHSKPATKLTIPRAVVSQIILAPAVKSGQPG